jgi:peroxiredoxin
MKQSKGKPRFFALFLCLPVLLLSVRCAGPQPEDESGRQKKVVKKEIPAVPAAIIPEAGSAANAVKLAPAGVSEEAVTEPGPAPRAAYKSSANVPYAAETAPDFALNDLYGGTVRLSDMKGRVVVLNFFATWCRYCVSELPELDSAERALRKERMDLFLISSEPKEVLEEFMRKNGYSFQVLLDEGGRVSDLYGVSSIPRTFLIGESGEILYSKRGEIRSVEQDLIAKVKERESRKR